MATSFGPTFVTGKVEATAAAQRVALSDVPLRVRFVSFRANPDNTGKVYLGGADVDADTNFGFPKGQGWSVNIDVPGMPPWVDLKDYYVHVENSGDGVDFYGVPV